MLDLKGKYADYVAARVRLKPRDFPADFTLQSLVEIGGKEATPKRGQRILFFSPYKRSRRLHFATAIVHFDHDDDEIVISMQWGVGSLTKRKHRGPVENLLDFLTGIQLTASIDVHAFFEFPRRGFKTIMPLPTRIFQNPSAQLDQLTGFRLSKFDGHTVVRSVIVEIIDQRLHFQTSNTVEIPLDTSLPTTVLNRSIELISPLLVRTESVREWLKK